ncbi:hypothetical protein [Lacrimispora sp.]|uniref:hypothetical protein n=1 Tax=Lacrimispora sp. TaxID=2719234 RepID=UPI0028AA26DB|nr:hypothetical protein [Lacrimispora sp.]
MRDLVELATSVDPNLPLGKWREEVCDLLLQELQTLKGKDLAPYLSEFAFDMREPGTRIILKFPIEAHVFDSLEKDLSLLRELSENQLQELSRQWHKGDTVESSGESFR